MSVGSLGCRLLLRVFDSQRHQSVGNRQVRIGRPVEQLEDRVVPAVAHTNYIIAHHRGSPDGTPAALPSGFTPSQIDQAYGINLINFGGVQQEGAGQTIAIIDAYDDPDMVSSSSSNFASSDLHMFDQQYSLPEPSGFFSKVDEFGGTNYPSPSRHWSLEISLDVEWVHALAPLANILLVEANSANTSDLLDQAAKWAGTTSPATVVTMSFGIDGGYPGENAYDADFESPAGKGVTFFASTGDNSAPGGYPAESDNVVAVGGTTLNVNSDGNYQSESVWGDGNAGDPGGGGGISQYESAPAFQNGLVIHNGSSTVNQNGFRATPDVAFDADPNTGVSVIDSYYSTHSGPWYQVGGTSFSSPAWASLMAIADEIRADNGLGSLDGPTQTLPTLYNIYYNPALYAADFHDITSGSNGYAAATGYDLGSGIGTPVANNLVFDLAADIPAGLTATIDSSGDLVIADTLGNPDNVSVEVNGSNYVITDTTQAFLPGVVPVGTTLSNNDQTLNVPIDLAGFTGALNFNLAGGNNTLTVNYSGGNFSNAINYNGGSAKLEGLVVEGNGTQSVTETPSGSTAGSGASASDAGNISFTNLTAIDCTGMASATMTFPNANDNVTVAAGDDYTSGGTNPALDVTGTSGNVGFVPAAFWNDANVAIDTTSVPGTDAVTVQVANNANGISNFTVTEPTSKSGRIALRGPVAVSGALNLTAANVNSTSAGIITTGTGLTVNMSGTTSTLAGAIGGAGGLTVLGTGTLDLTGTDTYTGTTTISAGELLVDGSLASAVSVASGATLSGATGTIAATVNDNGTLTMGDSSAMTGQLTVGNLSFGSNSTVSILLNGTTGGASYDQLMTTGSGTVNLNNATLNLSVGSGFNPPVGTSFDILVNNGGKAISGTFVGLPQGSVITVGNDLFTIDYFGGVSGNDVVLTAATTTSTTLNVNGPDPSENGFAASFTTTVTPASGSPISGEQVEIEDASNGNAIVATPTIQNGAATFSIANLSAGSHNLFALYPGDFGHLISQSSQVTQLVQSGFQVVNSTATPNGVVFAFNAPVGLSSTHLYNSLGSALGSPDVTVTGQNTGGVEGSLVFDPSTPWIGTFVKTAGLLATDTYSVNVTTAVKDAGGNALGSAYSNNLSVTAPSTPLISIASFARGPGQAVNVPNTASGIPVSIANATNVTSATFSVQYNPTLLTIAASGAVAPSSAANSAGLTTVSYTIASVDANNSILTVTISAGSGNGLTAGSTPVALVDIAATVPYTAPYLSKAELLVSGVSVNSSSATGVSGIDEDAYLGDVLGQKGLNAQEALVVLQDSTGLGSGFDAYADLDPIIIGDPNSSGQLTAADALQILKASVGNTVAQIPAIPNLSSSITAASWSSNSVTITMACREQFLGGPDGGDLGHGPERLQWHVHGGLGHQFDAVYLLPVQQSRHGNFLRHGYTEPGHGP